MNTVLFNSVVYRIILQSRNIIDGREKLKFNIILRFQYLVLEKFNIPILTIQLHYILVDKMRTDELHNETSIKFVLNHAVLWEQPLCSWQCVSLLWSLSPHKPMTNSNHHCIIQIYQLSHIMQESPTFENHSHSPALKRKSPAYH